jgi:predicted DNA-binding transcriptional regulator AlpA
MEKLLNIHELGELLGISERGIRQGLERRKEGMDSVPPPIRIGRRLRWSPTLVAEWLGVPHSTHSTSSHSAGGAPPQAQSQPHKRRGPGRPRKEVIN